MKHNSYSDEELELFFSIVAEGYTYPEARDKALLDKERLEATMSHDIDVRIHIVNLSMMAGHLIRTGKQPVPDRIDGLYEEYRNPANWESIKE